MGCCPPVPKLVLGNEITSLGDRDVSFLSRLFGGRQAVLEREVHSMYAQMLCSVGGYSAREAGEAVIEAIAMCRAQGVAEGTTDLPENFGDRMIEAARMGEPKSRRIVDKARQEGATEADIREWWNLPDLCRRMVIWSENTIRYGVFLHARNHHGLPAEDAAVRVRTMFPIYGDPEDTSALTGDDRPLPHELRGRVDSYKQVQGAERIASQVRGFSSYNSFVRYAIRTGLI